MYPGGEFAHGWEKVLKRARSTDSKVIPGLMATVPSQNDLDAVAADSAGAARWRWPAVTGDRPRPQACGGPASMLNADSRGEVGDPRLPGRSPVLSCRSIPP